MAAIAENATPSSIDEHVSKCTLPDDDTWITMCVESTAEGLAPVYLPEISTDRYQEALLAAKSGGDGFTDPDFPPDDTSVFHSAGTPKVASLVGRVKQWRRVGELFNARTYLSLTFMDIEDFPEVQEP